jgi:hypothetical protein
MPILSGHYNAIITHYMNRNLLVWPVMVACTLAAADELGQSSGEPAVRLTEVPVRTGLNQFRVNARMGPARSGDQLRTADGPTRRQLDLWH